MLKFLPLQHKARKALLHPHLLEQKVPEPALLAADRNEIDALCRRFDEELGPATRSLIFSGLINESAYTANMFSKGKSPLTRFFYRWTFPLVKPVIKKANGVNPENLKKAPAGAFPVSAPSTWGSRDRLIGL